MIIGGEDSNIMLPDDIPILVIGRAHAHAEFLGLVGPGDDAAVVVAEHDDGLLPEIRAKEPFARAIEAVTVDDGVQGGGD
jgi:hypothetical protein